MNFNLAVSALVLGCAFATLPGCAVDAPQDDADADRETPHHMTRPDRPDRPPRHHRLASTNPGSTITLSVSKGPKTSAVPDVTSQDQASAQEQLSASGFRVRVVTQPVTDESQDGIVLSQNPNGGTQAPPNTTVTIVVGKLSDTPTTPGPPP